MNYSLSILEEHHEALRKHLFNGDGKESVAIALCGQYQYGDNYRLLVQKVYPIPDTTCSSRSPHHITWKTDELVPYLNEAEKYGLSVLKIHGHPLGYSEFSEFDDTADRELFPSVYSWVDKNIKHGSAIMLPDGSIGSIFGRIVHENGNFTPFSTVKYIGEGLQFWSSEEDRLADISDKDLRNIQALGEGTVRLLKALTIGVVGCSGTGSLVVEQLAKMGVGRLILIDPDIIEEKNLNRIVNATMEDVRQKTPKVKVMERMVHALEFGTEVVTYQHNVCDSPDAVRDLAGCDILFGCVDSIEGRHLLNRLATFYLVPFFDVGVKLQADGEGGIERICGSVNYLQPGKSSLLSRGLYNLDTLKAEALRRQNPDEYAALLKEKYIKGINVDRPAVMPVNMIFSGLCAMELLARIHHIKDESDRGYGKIMLWLDQNALFIEEEEQFEPCQSLRCHLGCGDVIPLLALPSLSASEINHA